MNRMRKIKIALLSVAGALALLFLLFLGLTLPLGAKGRLIPGAAFTVTGAIISGLFLAAAAYFFLKRKK